MPRVSLHGVRHTRPCSLTPRGRYSRPRGVGAACCPGHVYGRRTMGASEGTLLLLTLDRAGAMLLVFSRDNSQACVPTVGPRVEAEHDGGAPARGDAARYVRGVRRGAWPAW